MIDPLGPHVAVPPNQPEQTQTRALREATQELEVVFLAEMLKSAGLGTSRGSEGGEGEEQFNSFLIEAQARVMVKAGGIGLSEHLFRALMAGNVGDARDHADAT